MHQVSFKLLFSFYLIIPLCLCAYILDITVLNGSIKSYLPPFPHYIFLFHLLFGAPHILASSVILFANREYYQFYKRRVFYVSLLIVLFLLLSAVILPYEVAFFIVITTSITHVIKQQLGIGNIICRLRGALYHYWAWTGISAGVLLYNAMFLRNAFSENQLQILHFFMLALVIIYAVLTLANQTRLDSKSAKLFLWCNFSLVGVPLFLYSKDYFFLSILAPRVIHDITAFAVYMVHDRNKHGLTPQNPLFRMAKKMHLNVYLVTPLIGIGIAYLLQHQLDPAIARVAGLFIESDQFPQIAIGVVTFFNLLHYYTETFTWGAKSPYRRFLSFAR